jgi:N-acetylmuramoyl-L-alanine amidase
MKKVFFILLFIFAPVFFIHASVPIKILIVPGHDNEVWGAQYGNVKEANMTLALGTEIFGILKKDKRFEVYITRNSLGYTTDFANYFSNQQADIITFIKNAKTELANNIQNGSFIKKKDNVHHNVVTKNIASILYGINKWANENKMDAVLHIHFNDYPRKNKWTVGQYKGFTIYMPEGQMPNSKESAGLAKSIFAQLRKKYTTSNYGKEKGGLVPEQSLVALGAYATLLPTVRSILIEYGYIYRFRSNSVRQKAYATMADLTARGITQYFFNK